MTPRTRHALQAAIATAIVAALTAALIFIVIEDKDGLAYFTLAASLSALATTFALWWLGFGSASARYRRAFWIGMLIPPLSMFVMFSAPALIPGSPLSQIPAAAIMAFWGTMIFGVVLIPIGIGCALTIRWWQLKGSPPEASPQQ